MLSCHARGPSSLNAGDRGAAGPVLVLLDPLLLLWTPRLAAHTHRLSVALPAGPGVSEEAPSLHLPHDLARTSWCSAPRPTAWPDHCPCPALPVRENSALRPAVEGCVLAGTGSSRRGSCGFAAAVELLRILQKDPFRPHALRLPWDSPAGLPSSSVLDSMPFCVGFCCGFSVFVFIREAGDRAGGRYPIRWLTPDSTLVSCVGGRDPRTGALTAASHSAHQQEAG